MRDFLSEFKAKIAVIDVRDIEILPVLAEPPLTKIKLEDPNIRRFNVHKRSLPLGSPPLDRIVFYNVSKNTADWLVERVVKARIYEFGPDDSKTLIYFDVVPVDAAPRERSIYFNPKPVVTQVVEGFPVSGWID